MSGGKTLDDLFNESDAERVAEIERDDTPAFRARVKAKAQREFDLAVREGWITPDGEPIEQPEDDDEEGDDDEQEVAR